MWTATGRLARGKSGSIYVTSFQDGTLDNTNRQPICRLYFNTAQKRLALLDANKSEEGVPVDDVSDIFAHAGRIRETAQRYLEKAVRPPA